MSLSEGGLYSLPNGREFLVLRKNEGDPRRLKLRGWERFEMFECELRESGRLLCEGKPTAGDASGFRNTGRTTSEFTDSLKSDKRNEPLIPWTTVEAK